MQPLNNGSCYTCAISFHNDRNNIMYRSKKSFVDVIYVDLMYRKYPKSPLRIAINWDSCMDKFLLSQFYVGHDYTFLSLN